MVICPSRKAMPSEGLMTGAEEKLNDICQKATEEISD